jgi:alkylation response protein AidB-like acyl-CoA dehydrogenase
MRVFDTQPWHEFSNNLRRKAGLADQFGQWPAKQLSECGQLGVHRWFVSEDHDGFGWNEADQVRGYLELSRACLTTAFILTQRSGAMRRIATSSNCTAQERWLPDLVSGKIFGTVGISHLTTSQQALGTPSLRAIATGNDRYRLTGFSPWITGAIHSQVLVVGATLEDGRQILCAIPTDSPGIEPGPGKELVALSGSCTDRVDFHDVMIDVDNILEGPVPDVMKLAKTGGTGGLQTSTLAIGLACEATDYLVTQSRQRPSLFPIAEKMQQDASELQKQILEIASGASSCTQQAIRQQANSFVLRSTQAALTAAKGTGFVADHPAGRWARQAMFFLVWSCPQAVLDANLCELAGLESL